MTNNEKLFERYGKEYQTGAVVFREGDVGTKMYVIQSGKVNITIQSRDVEKVLVTLGVGDFFGEMALINQKPRSASAVAVENSRLLVIEPKTFDSMIRGNTEIAIRMIKILAQRLQEADAQIENLMLQDHNSKVVHFLTHLASKGKHEIEGILVEINSNELAKTIGLQKSKVDEVLNKLFKAKLLREHEKGFMIFSVIRLQEFLEFLDMKEKFGDV